MEKSDLEFLKNVTPWIVVKWATALAVVVFWVLSIITAILFMVGYY